MCDEMEFIFLYVTAFATTEMANNCCLIWWNNNKAVRQYLDLKSEQWALTEEPVKVVSPFEVAITYFGSEVYASISSVLPIFFGLLENIQSSPSDHTPIKQFKKEVERQIKQRWRLDADSSSILKLASVLDPWFKHLKFLVKEAQKVRVHAGVFERLERLNQYSMEADTQTNQTDQTQEDLEDPELTQTRSKKRALERNS